MIAEITKQELQQNPLFWYVYLCWFRGYDKEKEISMDEVLSVLGINQDNVFQWEKQFFNEDELGDDNRYMTGKLNDLMSITIEFEKYEINYFLNDQYIGCLGGHFEAWFLTWDELLAFDSYEYLFLLLLPMTGVESHQVAVTKPYIARKLGEIPLFSEHADYLATCIVNGLLIEGVFSAQSNIGTVNKENHSVKNIEKYPRYEESVILVNSALEKFMGK